MYFAIPDDEKLHVDKSRDDRLVLTGLHVDVTPEQAIAGKALVVRATTVRVSGRLRLPGGRIEIFARRLIAEGVASLDVSGSPGSPDHAGRGPAMSGTNPGEAGRPGENGGDGQPGGQIVVIAHTITGPLSLYANGGRGGAAQSGGNGATGSGGRDHVGCAPAQRGRPGGAAGRAGRPGRGGNGGDVRVVCMEPVEGSLDIQANAGEPGQPGSHGRPGKGGPGGKGGVVKELVHEICVR